eukprot:scaffold77073_cov23-Tisochrysis_lutea.AAC.1
MDHSKDRVFKSVSAEKAKSATASAAAGVLNGWLPGIMTGLWRVKCGRQGGRRGAISLAAGGQPVCECMCACACVCVAVLEDAEEVKICIGLL